jgi:DNA uptake protein ComE-like DNA-binding protein
MPALVSSYAADKVDVNAVAATKQLLDINRATKEQLMMLPGIGDKLADKIISNRPYKKKTDLVSKNVLNQATYNKIASAIIAKQK